MSTSNVMRRPIICWQWDRTAVQPSSTVSPLGFANVVRRGNIGLVAASGTGLQQVACLIDRMGTAFPMPLVREDGTCMLDVGGITMQEGIAMLASDSATDVIVLISKPAAPTVAQRVLAVAEKSGKPVVVNFIGAGPPIKPHVTPLCNDLGRGRHAGRQSIPAWSFWINPNWLYRPHTKHGSARFHLALLQTRNTSEGCLAAAPSAMKPPCCSPNDWATSSPIPLRNPSNCWTMCGRAGNIHYSTWVMIYLHGGRPHPMD